MKIKFKSSTKNFEEQLYDAINSEISEKLGTEVDIRKNTSVNAPADHFFTPEFIQAETNNKFQNIEDFLAYIDIRNTQDLKDCPDEKINDHVKTFTSSSTWQEFFDKAVKKVL